MWQVKKFNSFKEISEEASKHHLLAQSFLFQSLEYQEVFANNFSKKEDLYLLGIYNGNNLVGYGGFEKIAGKILFLGMKLVLGEEEVTDYGEIVVKGEYNQVWLTIINYFQKEKIKQLQLDYVREDSRTLEFFRGLKTKGVTIVKQEVAPFIDLPETWEAYLENLPRLARKELKRKIYRLEKEEFKVYLVSGIKRKDFQDFILFHRLSDPQKEKFMSQSMEAFFWDLMRTKITNWQTGLYFLEIDERRAASVMVFSNQTQVLYYNSGFHPKYGFYSPGLLLKALIIQMAIREGKKVVDFLRGDERYKYDLGAKDLDLYRIKLSFRV